MCLPCTVSSDPGRLGWAHAWLGDAMPYYRLGLQSLDRCGRGEAVRLLNNALEVWEAGYSILPKDGGTKTERLWREVHSKIESARRRAKSKWRLW
jgi:hypothetical protein